MRGQSGPLRLVCSVWRRGQAWRRFLNTASSKQPLTEVAIPRKSQSQLLRSLPLTHIRNFSITAHIDHGKSTLADRMLELLGNVQPGTAQVLDNLEVERSRGITVKAQTASLFYHSPTNGEDYLLNLVDTPGHVDFSYEVSRSLAACQGSILLVDATQGVQAQTLANHQMTVDSGLVTIPVLNKIDMDMADPDRVGEEMMMAFDFDPETIHRVSAKTGQGVEELLERVVTEIPPPTSMGNEDDPMRAFVFDSWYELHRGVVCLVQIQQGRLRAGDCIGSFFSQREWEVLEVGIRMPSFVPTDALRPGQVGYVLAGIKTTREIRLGDTIFHLAKLRQVKAFLEARNEVVPFPGFKPASHMVHAGLYPDDTGSYDELRLAMEKLTLNDASVAVEEESSAALGRGFRCGFLGALHMDVFKQRLEQEFGARVVTTAPTVPYIVDLMKNERVVVRSPLDFPEPKAVKTSFEPMVKASIVCPETFYASVMELAMFHEAELKNTVYLSQTTVMFEFVMPLLEIMTGFYTSLKTVSRGYGTIDLKQMESREVNLVRLDVLLNGEEVDALSVLCPKRKAPAMGRKLVEKLKKTIHRQQFEVAIQAAVGSKTVAKARLRPYRKDVLNKSGKTVGLGDPSRKRKLLEKQKAGKKRMKLIGRVDVPHDAFSSVLE